LDFSYSEALLRYIRFFITVSLILYILYRLLLFYYSLSGRAGDDYVRKEMVENSDISISYVLDDKRWLIFPFEMQGGVLRILTNANIPRGINLTDREWGYAIRYQLIGKGGDVLVDRTYHLNSKVTFYKDDRWGEYTSSFYPGTDIVPADSRGFRLNISDLGYVRDVRFILVKKDRDIRDVSVRVYILYKPARIASYMWKRLSEKRKERMAIGNVYPPELLTDEEKINLLKNQWRPLGALGTEGKDFIMRRFYILKEVEGEEVGLYIPPVGLLIKKGHHATIPVPEGGGRLRIEFYNDTGLPPHDIRLSWYGMKFAQFLERSIRWEDNNRTSIDSSFDAGIIDIFSEDTISMRVFLVKDKEEEITPEPLFMRGYIINQNNPVTFHIAHTRNHPTPFKASLRLILKEGLQPVNYVTYELLGEEKGLIYKGRLLLNPLPSLYDTLMDEETDVEVSEPQDYYFYLPAGVKSVRFYSDTDVLVSGYTRVDGMVRTVRVPQDYSPSTPLEEKEPSWFAMMADDHQSLIYRKQTVILFMNTRPPERKEELLKGIYEWEDYIPEGSYEGYHLLTDEIEEIKAGREGSPDYYFPLKAGNDNTVSIREIKGLTAVAPQLIYLLEGNKTNIRVYVDDKPILSTTVYNTVGEITLLPIKIGTHRIRIESSDGGSFYINNIEYQGGNLLFKRFTSRLKDNGLSFLYDRKTPTDDTLSVRFYAPKGNNKPNIIDVIIETERRAGLVPSNKWTFLKRRFIITPDDSTSIPILYTQGRYLQRGQLLFIPINEDIPVGRYRITIKPVTGSGGYVSLHKVTPGEYEMVRFYSERALSYEYIP